MKVVWGFSFVLFLTFSPDSSIYRATGQRGLPSIFPVCYSLQNLIQYIDECERGSMARTLAHQQYACTPGQWG
jgi:hypothetical protein